MSFVIYGYLFGCLIPCFARRIGKSMSCAMGYTLFRIFMPYHYMSWSKLKENPKYMALFNRYLMRSLGWGIFTAPATYLFATIFGIDLSWWYVGFLWCLLLLVEIDKRFLLLPDFFTYPLIIAGFAYSLKQGIWLHPLDVSFFGYEVNSVLGAVAGYMMPLVASLFIIWKYPNAFGDGDIKLLAAIGAWVGIETVSYILLLSCIIFCISCIVNKQRSGPFGPAIVYATLIINIFLYGL